MSVVGELDRLLSDSHDRLVESAVARVAGAGGDAVPVGPAGVDVCVREVSDALRNGSARGSGPIAAAHAVVGALDGGGAALPGSLRVLKALRHSYAELISDELTADTRPAAATALHEFFDAAELALVEQVAVAADGDVPGVETPAAAGSIFAQIFDAVLSTAPHQLYAFDADLRCVFSRVGSGVTCPISSGGVGQHLSEFDLPRSFTTQLAADARVVLQSGRPQRGEVVLIASERTVHCGYTLLRARSVEDQPDILCLTLSDMTELREAQQAEREATDWRRAVYSAAPVAAVSVDLEGRVTSWSPGAEQMFGWTEAEVLGRRHPIVADEDWDEYLSSLSRAASGQQLRAVDARRRHKDGSWVDVSLNAAPLHGPDRRPIGVVRILVDTTARRQVERNLAMSEERFARMTRVVPAVFANAQS